MRHFEACIGDQWMAWDASDKIKIKKTDDEVIITQIMEKDDQTFTLKTVVNIYAIPAYASY